MSSHLHVVFDVSTFGEAKTSSIGKSYPIIFPHCPSRTLALDPANFAKVPQSAQSHTLASILV